jgi:hypothetical protein
VEDLIFNQQDIPKSQWRYGFRSSSATGCGWIATYNALHLMGYKAKPEELIRCYERQLPLINGNVGTVMFGPALWFHKRGFPVKPVLRRSDFDQAAKDADVCILYYRWLKKYRYGAHFVALHHTEDGFVGYNTYQNSTGPDKYGPSLEAFLRKKKYFGAVLFCICKK